jgi:hypothetical protein
MKEKLKKFKHMQALREKHYDFKTLIYYILHMSKVDDNKTPDYIVAIPWFQEDCFDFVEYAAFDEMVYYTLIYSYNTIPNPCVKVDGNKISIVARLIKRWNYSKIEYKSRQKATSS